MRREKTCYGEEKKKEEKRIRRDPWRLIEKKKKKKKKKKRPRPKEKRRRRGRDLNPQIR